MKRFLLYLGKALERQGVRLQRAAATRNQNTASRSFFETLKGWREQDKTSSLNRSLLEEILDGSPPMSTQDWELFRKRDRAILQAMLDGHPPYRPKDTHPPMR